jgi:hypothetical protein
MTILQSIKASFSPIAPRAKDVLVLEIGDTKVFRIGQQGSSVFCLVHFTQDSHRYLDGYSLPHTRQQSSIYFQKVMGDLAWCRMYEPATENMEILPRFTCVKNGRPRTAYVHTDNNYMYADEFSSSINSFWSIKSDKTCTTVLAVQLTLQGFEEWGDALLGNTEHAYPYNLTPGKAQIRACRSEELLFLQQLIG